jgi:methionine biosynthesis protein MetW
MMKLLRRYLEQISAGADYPNKRLLLGLLEPKEKAKILEIGCGNGKFSKQIGDKIGGEVYGIEISRKQAAEARRNGINMVVGDIDQGLPFRDESFDLVISNQVIEHVNNTDNFVIECHRVLKNGGICIASTPNLASFHNIFSLMLGYQPPVTNVSDMIACGNPLNPWNEKKPHFDRRHKRVFTAPALRRLFEFYGFKVEALKGIGMHPLPSFLSRHIKWARYSIFLTIKARKLET